MAVLKENKKQQLLESKKKEEKNQQKATEGTDTSPATLLTLQVHRFLPQSL